MTYSQTLKMIGNGMAQTVTRHNAKKEKQAEIKQRIIDTIENTPQWPNGKTVDIVNGPTRGTKHNGRLFLKARNGLIWIQLIVPGVNYESRRLKVGHLSFSSGWVFDCDDYKFTEWQREVSRELDKKPQFKK
jgi:hypothetical protein